MVLLHVDVCAERLGAVGVRRSDGKYRSDSNTRVHQLVEIRDGGDYGVHRFLERYHYSQIETYGTESSDENILNFS